MLASQQRRGLPAEDERDKMPEQTTFQVIPFQYGPQSTTARLSALYNLIRGAMLAVDNNDRITAKTVLTNAEAVVLAMMEQGK